MAEPGNGGEIIIKGGSVEIDFDGNTYTPESGNPRKHKNANKKITRVVITDDTGRTVYDSGDQPSGLKWEIKTICN